MIVLIVKLALEIVMRCHCNAWTSTSNGMRCVEVLDYPRCELVVGWHFAAFGVPTCSHDCDRRGPD